MANSSSNSKNKRKSLVQDGSSAKRKQTCTGKTGSEDTPETSNKDTTNPPVEMMEKLEEELRCNICTEVLIKPTVINCSHMFCEFCILTWKKQQGRCPICREIITYETRVLDVHNFIEKVLPPEQKKARQGIVKQREKYAARQRPRRSQRLMNRTVVPGVTLSADIVADMRARLDDILHNVITIQNLIGSL